MNSHTFLTAPVLLPFSYAIQGYILQRTQSPVLLAIIIGAYVCIQLAALVPVVQSVEYRIRVWIGSDVIHLAAILTTTFFLAVAMVWIKADRLTNLF